MMDIKLSKKKGILSEWECVPMRIFPDDLKRRCLR